MKFSAFLLILCVYIFTFARCARGSSGGDYDSDVQTDQPADTQEDETTADVPAEEEYECIENIDCDDELPCTDDLCDDDTHTCSHPVSYNTTVCRAAAGDCDVAEYCNGTDKICPADAFLPNMTECRVSAGDCDIAEYCPGDGPSCPVDTFLPDTTECRVSAGDCDVVETCTGDGPSCPADQFKPAGTPCSGGDEPCLTSTCDGNGSCIRVQCFIEGVEAISAGYCHTCALMSSGAVKCWGSNDYGQLGDGTITDRNKPVEVTGLSSGVAAISAGAKHTCALMSSGAVKCWGDNYHGQLGDGTTDTRYEPVEAAGLSSGVAAISAGGDHTCALMSSGAVKCWGGNYFGQLGDGTTDERHVPIEVTGLSSGVAAISAGDCHTCALMSSGVVKCWGWNLSGQLGDGTTNDRHEPVEATGLSSGVAAISAGADHTCSLMSSGAVKCWGYNYHGQLGDGTTTDRHEPVEVTGLSSGVAAISVGGDHTCSLISSGAVKCWGSNNWGQLGDGTTTERHEPVEAAGLSSGVAAISAGGYYICALMSSGAVKCWGYNNHGQLGDGTLNDRHEPVSVCCE